MGLRNVLKIVVGWLLLDKTDGWCSLGRILRVSALINSNESSASSWSATRTQHEHGALANALGVMLVVATAAPNMVVAAPIPMELTAGDQSVDYALNVNRRTSRRLAGQVEKKKSNEKAMEKVGKLGLKDVGASLFFGGALYFISGSRNSPLIPFLGEFLYEEEEQWMIDRKDKLYSPVPFDFLVAYVCLIAALGVVIERLVLFFGTAGDVNLVLQLSIVALINGGFLELSRIDSGEKGVTRDEAELSSLWESEFADFAELKIVRKDSGSCHRNDVVKAYRRFYSKYRTSEVEGGPSDIDIEQLFVQWNKFKGSGVLASQAGFVKGIVLLEDAQF